MKTPHRKENIHKAALVKVRGWVGPGLLPVKRLFLSFPLPSPGQL